MRATYSILFIVLILALIGCTLLAKRSDRPCRRGVMWLDISLILPLAGSLIRLVTENRTAALIGHYFHYIGIDIVLVALVSFTNTYCQGIGDGNGERKPTVMYLMLTADMIQLKNGVVLQLAVNGERVIACGTWACPEFFDAFQEALQ